MNARVLMFNKRVPLYRASAAAQFHHKSCGMVQEMKFGSGYRNMGMIKGKTEKSYGTPTTTSAFSTHTSSTRTTWIEFFKDISVIFLPIVGGVYTIVENNERSKVRRNVMETRFIDDSRARLRSAFSMSKNGDLLNYDKLMDKLDRVRTVDSVCVKCNVDESMKNWVEDRNYNQLKDSKDMEVFRDFLLTLHEGAKTYQQMKKKAREAEGDIDMEDIWVPFLNGSQEGKILQKVVLKFYNFYIPEEKEGVEYSRIVGNRALWSKALRSRQKYVQDCIGGSGYGNKEVASGKTGEKNWNNVLEFLMEIDPRFDHMNNLNLKYHAGPEPIGPDSKDC